MTTAQKKQKKLQTLDAMTLATIKWSIEEYEKFEGKLPEKLAINTLMSIALREDPKIVKLHKELGGNTVDGISFGCLNKILEAEGFPRVFIDNAIGNNILALF